MAKRKETQKLIWPVAHPTSQFKEDVKEIAQQKGWKIIDEKFCSNIKPELLVKQTDRPSLNKIDKKKQAAAHKTAAASELGFAGGAENNPEESEG